jgi:metal transporter CNNM
MTEIVIWLGITLCLTQSAMFSGLNLAVFSLNRLNLEVEVAGGNLAAQKVLDLRSDSNFVLTTILWGNVGINVLLTLLSDSVLAGVAAFAFSTILITICGEIAPQAYFSRNALKMATLRLCWGFTSFYFFPWPSHRPLFWMPGSVERRSNTSANRI